MNPDREATTLDLIRWTFNAAPDRQGAIEEYLNSQGLEFFSRPDGRFVALWDEPDGDPDEVIEGLWQINGEPFEVTHETFSRLDLLAYGPEPEGEAEEDQDEANPGQAA